MHSLGLCLKFNRLISISSSYNIILLYSLAYFKLHICNVYHYTVYRKSRNFCSNNIFVVDGGSSGKFWQALNLANWLSVSIGEI